MCREKSDRERLENWNGKIETLIELYSSCTEGEGVGGGERDTAGLVAGPPPLLVFLRFSFCINEIFLSWSEGETFSRLKSCCNVFK